MAYFDRFDRFTTALQVVHNENLSGKIYLITGATKGIGYETARSLALHGATIILCGSSADSTTNAKNQLLRSVPNADLRPLAVNLNSLNQVKKSCAVITSTYTKLDGLVLNAGIGSSTINQTEDDFETIFQVNYLSHFYMILLLSNLLGKGSRIVCLTSTMHRFSKLTTEELSLEAIDTTTSCLPRIASYSISKLFMALLPRELSRKLSPKGVLAFAVHPGVTMTEIFAWPEWFYFRYIQRNKKTPEQGAAGVVYALISKDIIHNSGGYIADTKLDSPIRDNAKDDRLAAALWEFSTELLKTKNLL